MLLLLLMLLFHHPAQLPRTTGTVMRAAVAPEISSLPLELLAAAPRHAPSGADDPAFRV